MGPVVSPGVPPEGELITATNGPVGGLTAAEVTQLINNAVATANQTRAQIRLPIGARAKMTIAVSDLDGTLMGCFACPMRPSSALTWPRRRRAT